MKIKFNGKDIDVKYTFNSFRYMEDFDMKNLEELDRKPFKIISITSDLLYGAVNYSPNNKYSKEEVLKHIEYVMDNEDITDLLTILMDLLEKSSFFKNLQKK